jgi:alpha-beta hydrolase superfamily lysophospholipase
MSSIADQAAQKPLITQLDHGEQTLAFYAWPQPPQNPRAAVLLLHGLGEHMGPLRARCQRFAGGGLCGVWL